MICATHDWPISKITFEAGPREGPLEKEKLANESQRNTTLFRVISESELAEVHVERQF